MNSSNKRGLKTKTYIENSVAWQQNNVSFLMIAFEIFVFFSNQIIKLILKLFVER